jgi:(R,R)-butanediol dehydrogenase / meso-butanediol dehydrogenase / diacetyl reductase
MLQARVHGPGDVRLDEVPEPTAGPGDVVLRVQTCGICGSDLGYIALGGVAGPMPEPMPIGHELAGLVEQVGPGVETLAVGDRVALDPRDPGGGVIGNGRPEGGFAPRLLVRSADQRRLHKLPDSMSFDLAALAEPLGVGMNAVDKLRVEAHEKAVVFGAGPIGLAAVASLRDRGCEDIVAVDLSRQRLKLAGSLGARATLNAGEVDVWRGLRALHGETLFFGGPVAATDVFVEASGAPTVITQVIGNARRGARLSIVALHRKPIEVDFLLVLMRELQITGAMEYPDDFGRGIDLLARRDLTPMITHRFPLERFHEALDVARNPSVAGKVMIEVAS